MAFNPEIHHRQTIRLDGFDYACAGSYFVTICVQEWQTLFGEISAGQMVLNEAGQQVEETWLELPHHYPGISVDVRMVMPNHFHGIIILQSPVFSGPRACPGLQAPADRDPFWNEGTHRGGAPTGVLSLPDVVHRLKSLTTARYRHGVTAKNWPPFPGRLWQRNYYERIIRDNGELHQIREYIAHNPMRWTTDHENPQNPS